VAIRRISNWAVKRKLIPENPIQRNSGRAIREFLFAMQQTGCRPSEVAKATARHVSQDWTIMLSSHSTEDISAWASSLRTEKSPAWLAPYHGNEGTSKPED
jgi:hypothetical protein